MSRIKSILPYQPQPISPTRLASRLVDPKLRRPKPATARPAAAELVSKNSRRFMDVIPVMCLPVVTSIGHSRKLAASDPFVHGSPSLAAGKYDHL